MSGADAARGAKAAARFLNPRSVAIVGISTRQGSAGQIILQCLKINNFAGDIHLVGRTDEPIDGRRVLKSADELPEGVDLAVFALPAAAVSDAIAACARRKVGSALVFAAGFAETGDYAGQDAVAELPRHHQQCRRRVPAHAVRPAGAARRDRGRRLRRPERRPARPLPARQRRPRRAAVLRDLDRQRGRAGDHRLHRVPGR
jgi:predicted CoA-binding protein